MKTKADYQQMAGELLRAFKDGDPEARRRVEAVWGKLGPQDHFGYQRAQHVIAIEHYAPNWGVLVKGLE